jgi:hypothetical protein
VSAVNKDKNETQHTEWDDWVVTNQESQLKLVNRMSNHAFTINIIDLLRKLHIYEDNEVLT